jgi:hypothetical protein
MAKNIKINQNFNLSYSSSEDESRDTVADINITFDNPKDNSVVIDRLNRWLTAIGLELEVVVKGKK